MIQNAAGLPIVLQASSVQLQDLVGSLSPGDTLRGRVVDLLPQNQALVNLRGQNVVAQLPANLSFAKGDILSLMVGQAEAGGLGVPASLVLKLVSTLNPNGPSGAAFSSASAASAAFGTAQLEQALDAARLPANALNLSLAQTLARLGAPLDAGTLTSLSTAAESLLANERGAGAGGGSSSDLQDLLGGGVAQFKLAVALNPSSQDALALAEAGRSLQTALDQAGLGAPSAGALESLRAAMDQALAEPGAASNAGLQTALAQLGASEAGAAGGGPASGSAGVSDSASWQPSGQSNSADLPAMREALAQWLGPLNQGGDLSAGALAQSARDLASSFSNLEQGTTQRLIAAVQAQAPGAETGSIQDAAAWALNQAADHFASLPAGQVQSGVQGLRAGLAVLGLPAPQADLSLLSPETVGEAVGWLGARGLPPQRPLVETVASWLDQGQQALPAAQAAFQSGSTLPEGLLDAHASLRQAYADLEQSLNAVGLDPGADGLDAALSSLATAQGLNLESGLAAPFASLFEPGSEAQASAGAASVRGASGADGAGLRGSLMRLENELGNALASASPGNQASLAGALKDAQIAARSFNAVPLQAQSAPAFDTLHLPLPVWMGGTLGAGSLSVTWRQGRARDLDDKDPVTVAVALDTESLGPVTVHLRVWKGSATADVVAQDRATARFLETGAADLRTGFAQNTPFALSSLDFSASTPKDAAPAPFSGAEPVRSGLSLSA